MPPPIEKPIPPDFPDLPEKLRKICGDAEYKKWQAAMEEWRANLAISTEIYGNNSITEAFRSFTTKTQLNLFNIAIAAAPHQDHPTFLVSGQRETFENQLICRNSDGIFIVQPAIGFNRTPANSAGNALYDDGILAKPLSAYYRQIDQVATSYIDGSLVRPPDISALGTKKVTEVFSPSYAPIFISGFSQSGFTEFEVLSGYFTVVPGARNPQLLPQLGFRDQITGQFVSSYSRSVPFVKNIVIAPMSEAAMTPDRRITLEGERGVPVYIGWKDMNTQSSRWTPLHLIDGQWWDGSAVNTDYTYSFFEE